MSNTQTKYKLKIEDKLPALPNRNELIRSQFEIPRSKSILDNHSATSFKYDNSRATSLLNIERTIIENNK